MPSWRPSGSTRRTSRALMRSLIRSSLSTGVAMRHHSKRETGGRWKATSASVTSSALAVIRPGRTVDGAVVAGWGHEAPLSSLLNAPRVAAVGTIWTPSGEQPVGDEGRGSAAGGPPPAPGEETPEELEAELAEVQRQLLETPASVIIANHAIGLFQLAALHLNQQPPNFVDAQLAIDALGAIVEGLGDRL